MVKKIEFKSVIIYSWILVGFSTRGFLVSLLSPLYPKEAEEKGITPSQYGLVFGISSVASFIFAPVFGHFGISIGPKILFVVGSFCQAVLYVGFGCLAYVQDKTDFLGISYFLRSLNGVADVAVWGAALCILIKLFPSKVARNLAFTEMLFGFGQILGPSVGVFFRDLGGFQLPFILIGTFGIFNAIGLVWIVPSVRNDSPVSYTKVASYYARILKSPSMLMSFIDICFCCCCHGIIFSMAEFQLESVKATSFQTAVAFAVRGASFTVSIPVVGWITDKIHRANWMSLVGNVFVGLCLLIIGPIPHLEIEPSFELIVAAMGFIGFGLAAVLVSTFTRAQTTGVKLCDENDIQSFLMISGIWSASFFFGNFLGPTLSGFLVEEIGFRNTTFYFLSGNITLLFMDIFDLGLAYTTPIAKVRDSDSYVELS